MRPLRLLSRGFAALIVLLSLALAPPALAAPKGPVILISVDGFRADYLDRGVSPVLSALAGSGVRAAMRPSFPSITFPNHYTLVTGLRPDHHGIVDNAMDDPAIPPGHFSLATASVTDHRWWDDAEPLWVTADRQGLKTATMFWPGSEAEIHGLRPDYWTKFNQAMPATARVDQVLAWLDLPAATRPGFITLYFDKVDHEGHMAGPDSPEVNAAVADTDAAIGRLVEGLKARKLFDRVNLIVVADHGMAAISSDRVVYLDDAADLTGVKVVTLGPTAGLEVTAAAPPDTTAKLLAPQAHAQCWRKAEIPAEYHYGTHRRVPPVFCLAETGWMISTHDRMAKTKVFMKGAHGYRVDAPEMAALFIAHGPAFRSGKRLATFDNVDVYGVTAKVLGVTPRANDGSPKTFKPVLTDTK